VNAVRRVFRILGYVGLAFVSLLVVAYGVVYAISESRVRHAYALTRETVALPTDSASLAEGKRLAQIRGCTGCHGALAQGDTFLDSWLLARVVSPNLTQATRTYSTDDLVRIVRHGVRPDGKSVVVMPSGMFNPLTDQDLGAILAYLKSLPVSEGPGPGVRVGPMARLMFTLGKFSTAAHEADSAAKLASVYPAATDSNWQGAYLARTACTECHGLDLRGDPSGIPPDLKIAGAYPRDAFTRLMRTGVPVNGRDLGLMKEVALQRFSHFTDEEIRSLHGYLVARASQ